MQNRENLILQTTIVSIFLRLMELVKAVSFLIGIGLIFLICMLGINAGTIMNVHSLSTKTLSVGVAFFTVSLLIIIFYIGSRVNHSQSKILKMQEKLLSSSGDE